MVSKTDVIQAALENGFEDAGFTTADPFENQKEYLSAHQEDYRWTETVGLHLLPRHLALENEGGACHGQFS
jgi:epoxyqueuosine reductase